MLWLTTIGLYLFLIHAVLDNSHFQFESVPCRLYNRYAPYGTGGGVADWPRPHTHRTWDRPVYNMVLWYAVQKVINFFRDIILNVEENEILHEIFRIVSRFFSYISCYISENLLHLRQCKFSSTRDFSTVKIRFSIVKNLGFYDSVKCTKNCAPQCSHLKKHISAL